MSKTAKKTATQPAQIRPETYDVILAPVITEKSTRLSEFNQVCFRVAIDATKPQIKQAVEALFKVQVKAVNTLVEMGKVKRFRGRLGRRADSKKAIVTLVPGSTIDVSTGI